jgi:hypothetical protein
MKEGVSPHKAIYTPFFLVVSLVFTLSNSNHFFFWDTISQVSAPANWYYDTGFRHFFVPDEIATGHPTFVPMYIAFLWKIFGKTLLVSHLGMFPFVFGILFQINRYIESANCSGFYRWLILIIVALDATLLSQMSLVSFDVVQIFFFLWCANSIVYQKNIHLGIAFTFLALTSLRGAICCGGIILFDLIYSYSNVRKISFNTFLKYLPGTVGLALFLVSFYQEKNWIIHNVVSGRWKESSEMASFSEIIRNIGLIGWRLVDFGRIGIWVILVYIFVKAVRSKTLFDNFFRATFILLFCQLIVFFPFLIFSRNFIGHRYLLPIIIPAAICAGYWVLNYTGKPLMLYIILLASAVTGYSMIYPKAIAQGWDATPAHWPYYNLRKEMLEIIKKDTIPVSQIGSFFPNLASFKVTDLSDNTTSFKEADLQTDKYILFSNVYNRPYNQLVELYSAGKWKEIEKVERRGVYLILFKRKE